MMTQLESLDQRVRLPALLMLFWSVFWLLNGLDKFFNRPYFFGVTRDRAFVEYFARLELPPRMALGSLYGCGVCEILLGLGFGTALALGAPVLGCLCLKASLLLFTLFSAADILFGDRQELWEHGTFVILVLASLLIIRSTSGPIGRNRLHAVSG